MILGMKRDRVRIQEQTVPNKILIEEKFWLVNVKNVRQIFYEE